MGNFMTKIRLNVTTDIRSLINIQRYAEKNRPLIVRTAANRYLQFLRNRYISLSAGSSSQWMPLALSTVLRKIRRGIADDPTAILREYDVLLNSLNLKVNGQITYVGYTSDKKHPRGPSVFFLVIIHADTGRRIIVLPSESVKKRMVDDIRKDYNKIVRLENSRKGK